MSGPRHHRSPSSDPGSPQRPPAAAAHRHLSLLSPYGLHSLLGPARSLPALHGSDSPRKERLARGPCPAGKGLPLAWGRRRVDKIQRHSLETDLTPGGVTWCGRQSQCSQQRLHRPGGRTGPLLSKLDPSASGLREEGARSDLVLNHWGDNIVGCRKEQQKAVSPDRGPSPWDPLSQRHRGQWLCSCEPPESGC